LSEKLSSSELTLGLTTGLVSSLAVRPYKHNISFNLSHAINPIDFNFGPADPAYSLLTGDTLLPEQEEILLPSYVVHVSVDPSVPLVSKTAQEEGESDPDRIITNARPAVTTDGQLSIPELKEFFSRIPKLRSAYDEGVGGNAHLHELPTFGRRVSLSPTRRGWWEPEYTSYTHWWQAVLGSFSPFEMTIGRYLLSFRLHFRH
jgi:hypothetical protein